MEKKKIGVIVADPAGNVTYFVTSDIERKDYAAIAAPLYEMEIGGKMAEQIGFIHKSPACGRAQGRLEMSGLEFCGNASRSFALYLAHQMGLKGEAKVSVDVSGADEILDVEVDTDTNYTKIRMPQAKRIIREEIMGNSACIVDFGGIIHVVVKDIEASDETFAGYRDYINKKYAPPAMGVMFWNTEEQFLTPVVYVRDVDTTYYEGSCGSGSTACCIAFGLEAGEGCHFYNFRQPAGTIEASCVISNATAGNESSKLPDSLIYGGLKVESVFIEGEVSLSEPVQVEVEI